MAVTEILGGRCFDWSGGSGDALYTTLELDPRYYGVLIAMIRTMELYVTVSAA